MTANRARTLPRIAILGFTVALIATNPAWAGAPIDAPGATGHDAAVPTMIERALLEHGPGPWPFIVTGTAWDPLANVGAADRATTMAHLEREAGPWLELLDRAAQETGGKLVAAWPAAPAAKVIGGSETLAALMASPGTASVELDTGDAVSLPEEPTLDEAPRPTSTDARAMMQADQAWDLGYRGAGVRIAVTGTGVDRHHEAFKHPDGSSRIVAFADCVAGGCDGTVGAFDDHGHGTGVAANAAGSAAYDDPTWGTFQEAGLAPAAEILGGKFLTDTGSGTLQGAMDALQWAFDEGADIAVNAWGTGSCTDAGGVVTLVRQLTALGMLSVFPAGATGPGPGTIGAPACSEAVISTGAVDRTGTAATWTAQGPCTDPVTGQGPRTCPDVVGLGHLVRTAAPRSGASNGDPSGYQTRSGSSWPAGQLAGMIAVAEDMKRDLTGTGWDTAGRGERSMLQLTSQDLHDPGPDNVTGYGLPQLLNVYALLNGTRQAEIVSTLDVSEPVVRQGETTVLEFAVRNVGHATAAGTFEAVLEAPDGTRTVLAARSVSLGLLDGTSVRHAVTVTDDVLAGSHTFHGSFAYAWTDPETGEERTALIEDAASFDVRRVVLLVTVDGLDPAVAPLHQQRPTFTLANVGNDLAATMRVELTVPDDYLFLPTNGFDPLDDRSRYADPPPDRVHRDETFGRVTLQFDVGPLPVGETHSFTTWPTPTVEGTYRLLVVAAYDDSAGLPSTIHTLWTQDVDADHLDREAPEPPDA